MTSLVETGREAAYRRRNARILLLADQGEHGPGQPDTEIVEQVGVTRQTVEKVRKRCVQDGLAATLVRRKRSRERATVLDGEGRGTVGRCRVSHYSAVFLHGNLDDTLFCAG